MSNPKIPGGLNNEPLKNMKNREPHNEARLDTQTAGSPPVTVLVPSALWAGVKESDPRHKAARAAGLAGPGGGWVTGWGADERASEKGTNMSADAHSFVSIHEKWGCDSFVLAVPPADRAGGDSVREQGAWGWQSPHAENPGTSSLMGGQSWEQWVLLPPVLQEWCVGLPPEEVPLPHPLAVGCPACWLAARAPAHRATGFFLSSVKGATPLQLLSRKTSCPHCNGSAQMPMASLLSLLLRAFLSLVSLTTKPLYLLLQE